MCLCFFNILSLLSLKLSIFDSNSWFIILNINRYFEWRNFILLCPCLKFFWPQRIMDSLFYFEISFNMGPCFYIIFCQQYYDISSSKFMVCVRVSIIQWKNVTKIYTSEYVIIICNMCPCCHSIFWLFISLPTIPYTKHVGCKYKS